MLKAIKSDTFARWFDRLQDRSVRIRIARRIDRVCRAGELVGDWKSVGGGVMELRVDVGPGYRVYVAIEGRRLLLLLAGGSKHRQQRDIEDARRILDDWRSNGGAL